tara:strand:+ start:611 stop:763 length:153 start_codon:yes stop_codon:yes gene_type:complete
MFFKCDMYGSIELYDVLVSMDMKIRKKEKKEEKGRGEEMRGDWYFKNMRC